MKRSRFAKNPQAPPSNRGRKALAEKASVDADAAGVGDVDEAETAGSKPWLRPSVLPPGKA
jgi:hypothetical protein